MRIGNALPPEPENLEKNIEESKEFDFIEIPIGEKEIPVEELNTDRVGELIKKYDLDVVVHLPFRQPLHTSVEEFNQALQSYFDRLLEVGKQISASKAVVHVDMRRGLDIENVESELINQMKVIEEIGEKHGIEICFENVNIGYLNGVELFDLGRILEENNLSMCLDVGHAFEEVSQDDLEEFFEEYQNVVSHFHIQDTREGDDLHMPVGSGDIDFEFLRGLEVSDQTFSLEIFTEDKEYLGISEDRLRNVILD